jgi:hypothetical protein
MSAEVTRADALRSGDSTSLDVANVIHDSTLRKLEPCLALKVQAMRLETAQVNATAPECK